MFCQNFSQTFDSLVFAENDFEVMTTNSWAAERSAIGHDERESLVLTSGSFMFIEHE